MERKGNMTNGVPVSPTHRGAEVASSDQNPSLQKKPKLFLHVGPLKTATTSLQTGFLLKQKSDILLQDNYQIIRDVDFVAFQDFMSKCTWGDVTRPAVSTNQSIDEAECRDTEFVRALDRAYDAAQRSSFALRTIHSDEGWSQLRLAPPGDSGYASPPAVMQLRKIFARWDVHVVLTYRPSFEWLVSRYAQYRKRFFFNSRAGSYARHYMTTPGEQDLLPEYFDRLVRTGSVRDTLGTLEVYTILLSVLQGMESPSPSELLGEKIFLLDMKSPVGVVADFVCSLPDTMKSCDAMTRDAREKENGGPTENSSADRVGIMELDHLVTYGWEEKLVSVDRHEAALALQRRMGTLNMSVLVDLPTACPSAEMLDWLWNRTLVTDRTLSKNPSSVADLRGRFDKYRRNGRFCSVNATAAMADPELRHVLFDTCDMQQHFLLHRMGKPTTALNPRWKDLSCTDE